MWLLTNQFLGPILARIRGEDLGKMIPARWLRQIRLKRLKISRRAIVLSLRNVQANVRPRSSLNRALTLILGLKMSGKTGEAHQHSAATNPQQANEPRNMSGGRGSGCPEAISLILLPPERLTRKLIFRSFRQNEQSTFKQLSNPPKPSGLAEDWSSQRPDDADALIAVCLH